MELPVESACHDILVARCARAWAYGFESPSEMNPSTGFGALHSTLVSLDRTWSLLEGALVHAALRSDALLDPSAERDAVIRTIEAVFDHAEDLEVGKVLLVRTARALRAVDEYAAWVAGRLERVAVCDAVPLLFGPCGDSHPVEFVNPALGRLVREALNAFGVCGNFVLAPVPVASFLTLNTSLASVPVPSPRPEVIETAAKLCMSGRFGAGPLADLSAALAAAELLV